MCAHDSPPPVLPVLDTTPAESRSTIQLSSLAQQLLERYLSPSPEQVSTLRKLWDDFNTSPGMEGYKCRNKAASDVGALLTLADHVADEVFLCVLDKDRVFHVSVKLRTERLTLVNDVIGRMRDASDEHVELVKKTYEEYLLWKRDKAKREYLKDAVWLMRIPYAMLVEVFARLDKMVKHKEAKKAHASYGDQRAEKLTKDTRPRQKHPPQLTPLTLEQVKTEIAAPSKPKKNDASLTPQASKRKERHREDGCAEGAPVRKKNKKNTGFVPKAGDWKCKLCGFWNKPWYNKCGGKYRTCEGKRKTDIKTIQEDDSEHEKYDAWNPHDHRVGDWQCSICGFFNIAFDSRCHGEDMYNEDPDLRTGCSGKRRYAKYIQEDDGHHSMVTGESEWIGDWWDEYCREWRGVWLSRCDKCGFSQAQCSGFEVKPGPGKKERPRDWRGYRPYNNPGFC